MIARGNAIRFLAVVLGAWVAVRATMLLPQPGTRTALRPNVRAVAPRDAGQPAIVRTAIVGTAIIAINRQGGRGSRQVPPRSPVRQDSFNQPSDRHRVAHITTPVGIAEPVARAAVAPSATTIVPHNPADHGAKLTPLPSRWSGSLWLVVRDGRGLGASLSGSQLGGSQTGLRLAYALGAARRVAIVGRFASPLGGSGQEGAIGIEWRPTRLPVRLVAEQRIGINDAAGGPSLGLVGGAGPLPVGQGFWLEGYGQAGLIKRTTIIAYADGAVRINRRVAMIAGTPIDLGGGSWGAIQPGAARLDLGPSIGARLPIGANRVRLSLDWRQRVAGNARPGSGPALSIGTDF